MIEYTVPFVLSRIDPSTGALVDQLPLNTPSGIVSANEFYFFLDEARCWARPGMRVTRDNVPQADGDIVHRSFTTGFQMHLSVQFWLDRYNRACGEDLRVMYDLLLRHLYALRNADGRIQWAPSGYSDDRMLNKIRLLEWPVPTWESGVLSAEFDLYTPFPYALDATEQLVSLDASIDNVGNAEVYSVMKVHGPVSDFELLNATTGLLLSYDAGNPGAAAIAAGHYAELDFFRNTVYLDGDVASLKPGLNLLSSDFFPIVPGPNVIQYIAAGGSAQVLFNPAWVS